MISKLPIQPVVQKLLSAGRGSEALRIVRFAALSKGTWKSFADGFISALFIRNPQKGIPSRQQAQERRELTEIVFDRLLEKSWLQQKVIQRAELHAGSAYLLGSYLQMVLEEHPDAKKDEWTTGKHLWVLTDMEQRSSTFAPEDTPIWPLPKASWNRPGFWRRMVEDHDEQHAKRLGDLPPAPSHGLPALWRDEHEEMRYGYVEGALLTNLQAVLRDRKVYELIQQVIYV
jgi:hypothetical protein